MRLNKGAGRVGKGGAIVVEVVGEGRRQGIARVVVGMRGCGIECPYPRPAWL